ncbi:hypothetical protein V502_07597 [Pseudogymnoascus sp. VKM F-4520 (FW-2644)]|nr:hypothetical protein V502_07597 [Pseudogymnoascus sp. VKM F-4520 (FW-2644)]
MPAPEVNQPKAQTMDVPSAEEIQQQPKPAEKMTVEEPVSMRGGGGGAAPVSPALSASNAAAKRVVYGWMKRDGYLSIVPEVEDLRFAHALAGWPW